MSAFKYVILSIFFISGGTKAQDFVGICNQMKNPLGTCDCPGNTNQLWISADCTEGFMCETLANPDNDEVEGCEIKCSETHILKVDPRSPGSWECVPKDDALAPVCPGAFHTECACTSSDPEVDCPIGECQCDGQLRINHDCTEGKYCEADGTHEDISCEEGQIVIVNYAATEHTWLWQCGDDDGRCPGAFQVGCEPDDDYPATTTTTATTTKGQDFVGICNQMKNPLGTCDCPGNTNQLWISADCTEGFMCETLANPENDEVEGCEIKCSETHILKVDPRSPGSWECVPKDDALAPVCPGAFHTECACTSSDPEVDCPIGECQCDGQLRINHDCTEGKYCEADGTHEDISCEEGQIVIVNYAATEHTWLWQCGDDDGRCPGAFQVGCEPDDDYPATTTTTTTTTTNGASSFSIGAITMVVASSALLAGAQTWA